MSKLYLHKSSSKHFKTSKKTVVVDLDSLIGKYEYEKGFFKNKYPKEMIITSKTCFDFNPLVSIVSLPVETTYIDLKEIDSHRTSIHNFNKCKELILTDKCKKIYITNNFGLKHLEHITIPYSIECFEDETILNNKINKITILDKNKTCTLDLGDTYDNIKSNIRTDKYDDKLIINISSKMNHDRYTIYYKDDELVYDKEILKHQVNTSGKEFNLIEAKKKYNCTLTFDKFECEKLILEKDDLKLLCKDTNDKSLVNNLEIQDNNEMKLIPKIINILLKSNEIIHSVESFNIEDKELYIIEIKNNDTKDFKYIFINDDLSYHVLPSLKLNRLFEYTIDELHIDINSNRFKMEEGWLCCMRNLTIPKIKNSEIITKLFHNSGSIFIKNELEDVKILEKDYLLKETIIYSVDDFDSINDILKIVPNKGIHKSYYTEKGKQLVLVKKYE